MFPFWSRSIELQDDDGTVVMALRSKQAVRGTVRIEPGGETMALMVTYSASDGNSRTNERQRPHRSFSGIF
jgi:hypothetical protein